MNNFSYKRFCLLIVNRQMFIFVESNFILRNDEVTSDIKDWLSLFADCERSCSDRTWRSGYVGAFSNRKWRFVSQFLIGLEAFNVCMFTHIPFLDTGVTFLIFLFVQHAALCHMPFLIANTILLAAILANVLA